EAGEPSSSKLIVSREVVAQSALHTIGLIAPAPDEFRAPHKRVVNRSLERPPSNGGIAPIQRCRVIRELRGIVPSRERSDQIDVRVIRDVLISAQMSDVTQVASLARFEQLIRITAEDLACRF